MTDLIRPHAVSPFDLHTSISITTIADLLHLMPFLDIAGYVIDFAW